MIVSLLRRLSGNRKGGTAIEYGLIAALVVITMIASFIALANTTVALWGNISNQVAAASPAT